MEETSTAAVAVVLALSFIVTWAVGLAPPLIIRFLIRKRPLGKWPAIGICAALWAFNIGLFTAMGSKSKTHGALALVAFASYFILRKPTPEPAATATAAAPDAKTWRDRLMAWKPAQPAAADLAYGKFLKEKAGWLLIAAGFFVLLVSMPFVQNYHPARGYWGSMERMKVMFSAGELDQEKALNAGAIYYRCTDGTPIGNTFLEIASQVDKPKELYIPADVPDRFYQGRIAFAYKHVFATGVALIFLGVAILLVMPRQAR